MSAQALTIPMQKHLIIIISVKYDGYKSRATDIDNCDVLNKQILARMKF